MTLYFHDVRINIRCRASNIFPLVYRIFKCHALRHKAKESFENSLPFTSHRDLFAHLLFIFAMRKIPVSSNDNTTKYKLYENYNNNNCVK